MRLGDSSVVTLDRVTYRAPGGDVRGVALEGPLFTLQLRNWPRAISSSALTPTAVCHAFTRIGFCK